MARKWWTLIAVCVATFMLLLDITVVNVALPDIQKDLHASLSSLQWVVDAYSLTLAAFLLTAGSFADRIGRRRVFTAGFAIFTFASFLCGISGNATLLNLARGLQGVGGAAMFATSLALIAQEFQGRERGTAIGAWGATIGGAVAVGPLVGGALTEAFGWEWIFFVNVPIGIGAIFLTTTQLANLKAPDPKPLDWPGLATFSLGLFGLIFGLIRGNAEGWSSPQIVASLATAVVLLVAFVVIEDRRDSAMLDLSLFRVPAFAGVSVVALTLSASMFAMFLYLTLYIQDVLGYGPLAAGVRFLPLTLLSFFVAPVAGKLSTRIPVRVLLGVGLGLVSLALLLMHGVTLGDDWTTLLGGFVLAGAGVGMVNPGIASTAIGVVSPMRAGMASGINNTFRQVGIATGVASLGAIFQSQVSSKLAELAPNAPPGFAEAVSSGGAQAALQGAPAGGRAQLATAANQAFISGFNEILLVSAVVALIGAVTGFALVRSRDFVGEQDGPPAAADPVAAGQPSTPASFRSSPRRVSTSRAVSGANVSFAVSIASWRACWSVRCPSAVR
jgi:EmrB/QacA subfamily drug resistance transporter